MSFARLDFRLRAPALLGVAAALLGAQAVAPRPAPEAALERAHEMHLRLERQPLAVRQVVDYTTIADLLATVWQRQRPVAPTEDARPTPAEEALYDAGGLEIALATDLDHAPAWRAAAADFERLLERFPSTEYRRNAEWALAQIDWYHRGRHASARRYLRDFVHRYPADARVAVARRQLRGEPVAPPPALLPASRDSGALHVPPTPAPAAARFEPVLAQQALPGAPPPGPVAIEGLRWTSSPDALSVIVDLSGQPQFERGVVPETRTVYFDIHGDFGRLMDRRTVEMANPLVRGLEIAQNRPGVIRLVIREAAAQENDAAMYFPNPARLVIAVRLAPLAPALVARARPSAPPGSSVRLRVGAAAPRRAAAARTAPSAPPAVVSEAQPLANGGRSLTRALGLKIGRIVLDAGHGGHDTGTVGPNGLDEKTVVLDVVLRLGKLLHRRLGAAIIYTRKDDTFIPLRERTAIANRAHADLFVSVHANSSPDHGARGIETYYLNLTRNPRALDVAARENAASEMGENQLQSLLETITSDDKRQESRALGHDLEVNLARGLDEDNRGVKSAPFIVLIGAHMPSVLAEISFLSNAHDARLLARGRYRQRIAEALYRGIARYIRSLGGVQAEMARQAPRPGTHLASAAGNPATGPARQP